MDHSDLSKYWAIALGFVLLVLGASWILLSRADPDTYQAQGISAPQEGFLAPDFSLQTIDGETLTLSDFRGQAVLVNLWASWCGPCRAEMPAMETVYQDYKDAGFVILAVNATNQDDALAAEQFANQYGLTYPILLDTNGQVSEDYQLRALPSSYFIDRNGIIMEVVIGGPMAEALLRTRVETILGSER